MQMPYYQPAVSKQALNLINETKQRVSHGIMIGVDEFSVYSEDFGEIPENDIDKKEFWEAEKHALWWSNFFEFTREMFETEEKAKQAFVKYVIQTSGIDKIEKLMLEER